MASDSFENFRLSPDTSDENVYWFGSTGGQTPLKESSLLSNFSMAKIQPDRALADALREARPDLFPDPVKTQTLVFPSTEHVWQALKCKDAACLKAFTSSGSLGSFAALQATPGFFKAFWPKRADISPAWLKYNLVGILAKMATDPKRAKKLHLQLASPTRPPLFVWPPLLRIKFNAAHPEHRQALLKTGQRRLLERLRNARSVNRWGSFKPNHGTYADLQGGNLMGQYLEEAREGVMNELKRRADVQSRPSGHVAKFARKLRGLALEGPIDLEASSAAE